MALELNRRRAVLGKIGEILRWQKTKEKEKGAQCVELRGFLCEVLARQFWRLDRLKSADEFLETHFQEQRRTACYLMVIHEHLPRISKLKMAPNNPGVKSRAMVAASGWRGSEQ